MQMFPWESAEKIQEMTPCRVSKSMNAKNKIFLVLIRDQASGTTLFMGRINDPTAK